MTEPSAPPFNADDPEFLERDDLGARCLVPDAKTLPKF